MSTVFERVRRLLQRAQPERRTSASGLESAAAVPFSAVEALADRLQRYDAAERLDAECPEAAAALDTIASLASASPDGDDAPFRIEWGAPAPAAAQAALDALVHRTHLGPKTFAIARDAARYGDNFLEIVLDEALDVVRLKHLPARQLFREEGAHGELLDPAFTQRRIPGGAPLVHFRPWQVVHIRWRHLGEQRYGRSHLAAAHVVWQRLRPLEESMRAARLERAYDKLVHYVDVPPEAGREEMQRCLSDYRRRVGTRTVYNPETGAHELRRQALNVHTDFFVPVSRGESGAVTGGDIKLLSPNNTQLAHIADVEYLHRQLLCALRVPAAFLGFERDVSARATLAQQDAEFARTIRRAQAVLSAAYRQVFDLQLLLKGIDPAAARYRITWPEVRVEDERARAEAELQRARAASILARMGRCAERPLPSSAAHPGGPLR